MSRGKRPLLFHLFFASLFSFSLHPMLWLVFSSAINRAFFQFSDLTLEGKRERGGEQEEEEGEEEEEVERTISADPRKIQADSFNSFRHWHFHFVPCLATFILVSCFFRLYISINCTYQHTHTPHIDDNNADNNDFWIRINRPVDSI